MIHAHTHYCLVSLIEIIEHGYVLQIDLECNSIHIKANNYLELTEDGDMTFMPIGR